MRAGSAAEIRQLTTGFHYGASKMEKAGEHEQVGKKVSDHYHNVLIEDPALKGASLAQARAYFQSWAAPFIVKSTNDREDKVWRTSCFGAYILLDETVFGNVQTFPARGDLRSFESPCTEMLLNWLNWSTRITSNGTHVLSVLATF